MIPRLAWRMMKQSEPRLLWKFAYNFGYKGMLGPAVQTPAEAREFTSRRFCSFRSSIAVSSAAKAAGSMSNRPAK